MASPILNCTNINTVVAYNLIRTNVMLFAMALIVSRLIQLKKAMKQGIKKWNRIFIGIIFSAGQIEIIEYKLNPQKRMINNDQGNKSNNIYKRESDSVFEVDSGFLSFLWRLSCK